MKPLVVIPARGGSKGIPRKNVKLLDGKPLINYTLEAARRLFSDDFICVSTDDEEIKRVVEKEGLFVPFIRPALLATDEAGTYGVLLHAISFYEDHYNYFPDTLVLLQPTSPLRTSAHVEAALDLYDSSCEMVVSVKETKANPYYVLREEDENGWLIKSKEGNVQRRQDCPKVWELNGAVYIINVNALKVKRLDEFEKVRKMEMEATASIDVDSLIDWHLAEIYIKKRRLSSDEEGGIKRKLF